MAADVKDRLVEEFKNSNAKSVTEEHTRIAEGYLRLLREQGDSYRLDLEVIKLDQLLELNNYNHSTIILAFEVLLSKYIVNLLQRQLPHKWWSLNTRNAQFSHRIKVMQGWDSLMKDVGYSERGEAGALTFPTDQRTAPDRSRVSLIAAELLIAKTMLKNTPPSRPPLQHSNMTQPINSPPNARPRPTPRPRTTIQKSVVPDSMGFPTSQFQQHSSLNDDSRGSPDERVYSYRPEEVEKEEMVRNEQEIPSVSSCSSSGTQEEEEKTVVVDDGNDEDDDDDDDEVLKQFKSFLSDHKQEKIANVSASAPQLIIPHSPQSPPTPPSSQCPAKPFQYQSLQQSNQKTPPIPKRRTKFLKAIDGGAPKPSIAPIPEVDDSPSLSKKPLSPQKQPVGSASPGFSHHKPTQPSVPAVGRMQNPPQVIPEQAAAAAASGSSPSPTCPKPTMEQKNAAEIEHFKLFNPQKQREYLDSKQQHNQPIVHLIPYFKGVTPKEPQPVFASVGEVEQEKRRQQMENDGLYLLSYIKRCVPLGFAPEEVEIAVNELRLQQRRDRVLDPLDYLMDDWLRKVEDTQENVHRKRIGRGEFVGRPSVNEVRCCLIKTRGDVAKATDDCFTARRTKIIQLLNKFQGKMEVSWDSAVKGLSHSNLSVEQAYYTIQCWSLKPLYEFLYESENKPMTLDNLKDSVLKDCKEKKGEQYQAILRMLMVECRLPTVEKAELLIKLLEHKNDYPMTYYIDAASNYTNFDDACKFLNQPCPICDDEYAMDDMVTMPACNHSLCRHCFTQNFTLAIKEKSVKHFTCPMCSEPDMMMRDQTQSFYLELFVGMIKEYLDKDSYSMCQQKLTDFNLSRESGFIWCTNQECKSGFIVELRDLPNLYEVSCPHCKSPMCFKCRKTWEDQHRGISCGAFAKWKTDNDPEAQKAGLAAHLNENGIQCPECKFRYDLAHGGCMHFRCTQCPNEFCSGCGGSFKNGKACGKFEACKDKGLHAHHPRDCLYYLRDFGVKELQKLLTDNQIKFDIEPPQAQVDAVRAAKEQGEEEAAGGEKVALHCRVMLQKEKPNGLTDEECGNPSPEGMAGLCTTHYKEYLVNKINSNKLDPLVLYEDNQIERILDREEKPIPQKEEDDTDEQYRQKLIEQVKEMLPLRREDP